MANAPEPDRFAWARRAARLVGPAGPLRRRGWWIAVGALVGLALLEPVLHVFGTAVALLTPFVDAALTTPPGRLISLNVALVVLAWWWWRQRHGAARVAALRERLLVRTHAVAVEHLLAGRSRAAERAFRRVIAGRRPEPSTHAHLRSDTRLALARLALADGRADDASAQLAELGDRDVSPELRVVLLRLRVWSYLAHGNALLGAAERALGDALDQYPNDVELLGAARELAHRRDDPLAVADHQERIVRNVAVRERPAAERRLVRDEVAAAQHAIDRGELEHAARLVDRVAARSTPGAAGDAALLRGVLARQRGDVSAALRSFGGVGRADGLVAIEQTLAGMADDALEPRALLDAWPTPGGVLLCARAYARRGDIERARRAGRTVPDVAVTTPSGARIWAATLAACGETAAADRVRRAALLRLAQPLSGRPERPVASRAASR